MNPYLFVDNPVRMIQFTEVAFEGTEISRTTHSENGEIAKGHIKD